jgi:hypothetical protein
VPAAVPGAGEAPILGAAIYVVLQQELSASGAIHLIVLGAISVIVIGNALRLLRLAL